ncbi:hypothetical protein OROGR_006923 [Orobanche gracilis]
MAVTGKRLAMKLLQEAAVELLQEAPRLRRSSCIFVVVVDVAVAEIVVFVVAGTRRSSSSPSRRSSSPPSLRSSTISATTEMTISGTAKLTTATKMQELRRSLGASCSSSTAASEPHAAAPPPAASPWPPSKVLDKTGMKGIGKWTVQQAADLSVVAPTIEASLDSRFLSGLKEERTEAAKVFDFGGIINDHLVDKKKLIDDVRQALYASKICNYAQGMNLIFAKRVEKGWDLKLGELARLWKGGCIIRAVFLDRIKKA